MKGLSDELEIMHKVPGCFLYCTGKSLWLSTQALTGAIYTEPVLLLPLTFATN